MPERRTKTAILFVNRKARRGGEAIPAALDLLTKAGFGLIEPPTPSRADLGVAIRSLAGDADCVIAGGGDGTLNAVADAVSDTGLPLGILPLGTANDLARTLGIPPDPYRAAEIITKGRTRLIDLGDVNGHPFFNVASIGFSVDLARNLTSEAKRRLGVFGYGAAASRLLAQSRPFTAYIDHDGRTEEVRTVQMSVGNGRYYGGGMTVEQSAQPDDGKLDFYSLEIDHWWELVGLTPALRFGTHGRHRKVRAFGTTELMIRTRRPHDINTDGELVTRTPAHFRIRKAAVRVFVP